MYTVLPSFSYRFLMTNGREGDILHYHFSADQFYILPILIVALAQHLALFFLSIWSAVVLKGRQLLHSTYKIFMFAIFLQVTPDIFWIYTAVIKVMNSIQKATMVLPVPAIAR